MGILNKVYICPEMDCSYAEEGKRGQICPKCGSEYQEMTSFQANNLRTFKNQIRNEKIKKKEKEYKKNVSKDLVNNYTSSEEINAKRYADIDNLVKNINWQASESSLEVQPILTGLKAIIDQNKLIIQQNELIYRELKRINEKK